MKQSTEQATSRSPYPFRIEPALRAKAQEEADRLDRSLNWILNQRLKESYGLKAAA